MSRKLWPHPLDPETPPTIGDRIGVALIVLGAAGGAIATLDGLARIVIVWLRG